MPRRVTRSQLAGFVARALAERGTIPPGGGPGSVLVKLSDDDLDYGWTPAPVTPERPPEPEQPRTGIGDTTVVIDLSGGCLRVARQVGTVQLITRTTAVRVATIAGTVQGTARLTGTRIHIARRTGTVQYLHTLERDRPPGYAAGTLGLGLGLRGVGAAVGGTTRARTGTTAATAHLTGARIHIAVRAGTVRVTARITAQAPTPTPGTGYGPTYGPTYDPATAPEHGTGYGPTYGPTYDPAAPPKQGTGYGPTYGPTYDPAAPTTAQHPSASTYPQT